VPVEDPVLTYTSTWNMENGFDWGYTILSTDGGKTYQTLSNLNTRGAKAPAPPGVGLTGSEPAATTQSFNLAAYAGQQVVLGFRYWSDSLIDAGGWYVDEVRLGHELISDGSSVAPFVSPSQLNPVPISGWSVALVGLDEGRRRALVERMDGLFDFAPTPERIRRFAGYPVVVAVVSCDDPTEQLTTYAPYTLTVNGIVQPGGR
jgi:hypothetical protein